MDYTEVKSYPHFLVDFLDRYGRIEL